MPTTVLIVGAGAVGAFYAARLAQVKDVHVSVVCRSNYAAVKDNGFTVESPTFGGFAFRPVHTFPSPTAAADARQDWDYVVVSTKALPDISDDSQILEGLVGPKTAILLIQNGLGVEQPYLDRFPSAIVLSAVTIISAAQPRHGHIKHNRWTRISVGPYLPHLDTSSARGPDKAAIEANAKFVSLLKQGGIKDAEEYDHFKLQAVRWHKIAINASMNPSSVLTGGTPNGAMVVDEELRLHLKGVMDEVLATGPKVLGRPFPASFATAEQIIKSTARNTTGSKPSMFIDWAAGKDLELEVVLGNPIRIARSRGLEMPRLQTLYALLRKAQENRRQEKQAAQKSKL